jgi:hypothetical protein
LEWLGKENRVEHDFSEMITYFRYPIPQNAEETKTILTIGGNYYEVFKGLFDRIYPNSPLLYKFSNSFI